MSCEIARIKGELFGKDAVLRPEGVNSLLVLGEEIIWALMRAARLLQALHGAKVVVELDEGSQSHRLLHLGDIHPNRSLHRMRHHRMLHTQSLTLAKDHQGFLGGNVAGS